MHWKNILAKLFPLFVRFWTTKLNQVVKTDGSQPNREKSQGQKTLASMVSQLDI